MPDYSADLLAAILCMTTPERWTSDTTAIYSVSGVQVEATWAYRAPSTELASVTWKGRTWQPGAGRDR